jgi:hypothetical protein
LTLSANRQRTRIAAPVQFPGQPADSDGDRAALTTAVIPGHGRFFITDPALEMIEVFGRTLHCYVGAGGCRKQGLYFSRTLPRKPLRCELRRGTANHGVARVDALDLELSVSHDLAPKLDGAVLDFGLYNKMQRFVWASLPAVKGPQCTCLRSTGTPAGKRSPCLDDAGTGLTDL